MPEIQKLEEAGLRKRVRQLRAQIVDDQKITVCKIPAEFFIAFPVPVAKDVTRQRLKKICGAEIQNKMSPFNQFLCRADGKERFSRSDCTIEIQIFIVFIKSINEMAADPYRAAETFQRLPS